MVTILNAGMFGLVNTAISQHFGTRVMTMYAGEGFLCSKVQGHVWLGWICN